MILCKLIPDQPGLFEVEGRHFESYAALDIRVKKFPGEFQADSRYFLITVSQVLVTTPDTTYRLNITSEVFPGAEPQTKKAEKPKTGKKLDTTI